MTDIASGRPEQDAGVADLLRQLADQGSHLAQQQAALIQAEVGSSIDDLKVGVGEFAGAAVVGVAGLGVILMALAYLLAERMDLWLATLIVGVAALLIAYILYRAAAKKMSATRLAPNRSKRTLERTPGAASGTL